THAAKASSKGEKKVMHAKQIWSASLVLLSLVAIPTLHAATGRTPGIFDVSDDGAASYSVPIWTPPGPRGMQPSLSLRYSSLSGNGPLGVGWSVTGLSSIERCRKT